MTILRTSDLAAIPYSFGGAMIQYANENEAKRAEMRPRLEEAINNAYEGFHAPLETEMLARQLNLYATKSTGYDIAPYVKTLGEQNNYDYSKLIDKVFEGSVFSSKDLMLKYLNNPEKEMIENDECSKFLRIYYQNTVNSRKL